MLRAGVFSTGSGLPQTLQWKAVSAASKVPASKTPLQARSDLKGRCLFMDVPIRRAAFRIIERTR
jgi:hypothetical protein